MICKYAKYENFRNIISEKIEFSDGINIIIGKNAQGKTNAIEGIYLCAQGRSHRTSHEKEFVNFKSEYALVEISYSDNVRSNTVSMRFSSDGKKYCEKNSYQIKRMSELIGNFRAVLFTPEHLSIVKEGPAKRRSFLDSAISQIDPDYLYSLQRYNKLLIQRNRLLLDSQKDMKVPDSLIVWSEQMAEEAEVISEKRAGYSEKIGKKASLFFNEMTEGREKPHFRYDKPRKKAEYLEMFTNNTEKEIIMGTTLEGIQKDDLNIFLNGIPARNYASQGQQRSIALSMKLAEGEISKEEKGEYPVFLFDDVLSELDDIRKEFLLNGLKDKQVIITTCDENIKNYNGRVIYAENGVYKTL